jgi:uncharacterized protein (TIGR03437 family)
MITSRVIFACFGSLVSAVPLLAQLPTISAIENNYSYTRPGVPNYGIAPGTLFVIFGSNLSTVTTPVLQTSAAPGVPLTLNGVSVSVSVNGVTAAVPLYYVSAKQVAGILPSNVPSGTGTITLTNNGQASAAAPITVVASNFGILTANNLGYGPAAAFDAANKILSPDNSTRPGQTIVVYGSGVGSDPANDDRIFPQKQNNLTAIPMQVFVGGTPATISYRGRSQFPGVDQLNVVLPQDVATGCFVSLTVMSGTYVSNSTTLPIAPNGGTCSDPNTQFTPAQLQSLRNKSTVNVGTVFVSQQTDMSTNIVRNEFRGRFLGFSMAEFNIEPPLNGFISYGSCQISSAGATPGHLNAGSNLTVSDSGGTQVSAPLSTLKNGSLGDYRNSLPSGFIPATGGTFTFGGSGSNAIGSFSNTSVTLPAPVSWTNMSGISTVNRAQGVTVTWRGAAPGTFVVVRGSASTGAPSNNNVSFACAAPATAGTFTVPASVLLAVPAKTGDLSLETITIPVNFTATGLDKGTAYAEVRTKIQVTYQ